MKRELPTWQLVLFFGVLFIGAILGIVNRPTNTVVPIENGVRLTKETCTASGGSWNACASPCAPGQELCAAVCVEICGCETDRDCPFTYFCKEGVNKEFVCQK